MSTVSNEKSQTTYSWYGAARPDRPLAGPFGSPWPTGSVKLYMTVSNSNAFCFTFKCRYYGAPPERQKLLTWAGDPGLPGKLQSWSLTTRTINYKE